MDGYGNDAMMMDVDMSKDMEVKITEVPHHISDLLPELEDSVDEI